MSAHSSGSWPWAQSLAPRCCTSPPDPWGVQGQPAPLLSFPVAMVVSQRPELGEARTGPVQAPSLVWWLGGICLDHFSVPFD